MTGRRAVARRTVLVAALVGTTAGCVRIPDSSPVRTSTPGPAASNPPVNVVAQPPIRGVTATALVTGFVEACLRAAPDYGVARQYLTSPAAGDWDPTAATTVFDSDTTWRQAGTGPADRATVVRDGALVGRLDRDGIFTAATVPGPPLSSVGPFVAVRVDGQLRLSQVPAGVLISVADFARTFDRWEIAYLDNSFQIVVPDAVHLPTARSPAAAATALVQRLLAGPSPWLAPVARSTLPEGTQLAPPGAVSLGEAELATVDLAGPVDRADDDDRTRLSVQVVTTLRQLGDETGAVTDVRIISGGRSLNPRGVVADQPVDSWVRYSAEQPGVATGLWALAIAPGPTRARTTAGRAGTVRLFRGDPSTGVLSEVGVPGLSGTPGTAVPRAFAVERLTGDLAVVDATGRSVLLATATSGIPGRLREVLTGTDIVGVHFEQGPSSAATPSPAASPSPVAGPDARSWALWAVERGGRVHVFAQGRSAVLGVDLGGPTAVGSLDLTGARVVSVVPARDGRRAALVVRGAAGRKQDVVLLARVRHTGGIRVEAPRLVNAAYPRVRGLVWSDASNLAMLALDRSAVLRAVQVRQDGWATTDLGNVSGNGTSLTAARDQPVVVVVRDPDTGGGQLTLRSASSARFTAMAPDLQPVPSASPAPAVGPSAQPSPDPSTIRWVAAAYPG